MYLSKDLGSHPKPPQDFDGLAIQNTVLGFAKTTFLGVGLKNFFAQDATRRIGALLSYALICFLSSSSSCTQML